MDRFFNKIIGYYLLKYKIEYNTIIKLMSLLFPSKIMCVNLNALYYGAFFFKWYLFEI